MLEQAYAKHFFHKNRYNIYRSIYFKETVKQNTLILDFLCADAE